MAHTSLSALMAISTIPTRTTQTRLTRPSEHGSTPSDHMAEQLNAQELTRVTAQYPTTPFKNALNVDINPQQGGVYLDTNKAAVAYATGEARRMTVMQEYLMANRAATVWVPAPEPVLYQGQQVYEAVPYTYHPWRPRMFGGHFRAGQPAIGRVNPNHFTRRLH